MTACRKITAGKKKLSKKICKQTKRTKPCSTQTSTLLIFTLFIFVMRHRVFLVFVHHEKKRCRPQSRCRGGRLCPPVFPSSLRFSFFRACTAHPYGLSLVSCHVPLRSFAGKHCTKNYPRTSAREYLRSSQGSLGSISENLPGKTDAGSVPSTPGGAGLRMAAPFTCLPVG